MRYIFSCGGTAGHINPAIAIADKLRELDEKSEIYFVGKEGGMEKTLVERAGYPIFGLDVMGIRRSLTLDNITALIKAFNATRKAEKLIEELKPDAVIGTGGYACYPMLKAAAKKGIYTVLHESNAVPGLAVKMLKKKVSRIFVSFEACKERLSVGEKCTVSGNPVSAGFLKITRDEARERLGMLGKYRYLIVSFGGSLGANTVNKCALDVMESISSKRSDVMHVHSCGKGASSEFFAELEARGYRKCKNISVSEYLYDMPLYLKAADVVMCRSGAMTLAEIAATGVASVLIPSPNVTANHQYENAYVLASKNAAFLVDEKRENELSRAVGYVRDLLNHAEIRREMAENVRSFSYENASEIIAKDILKQKISAY